MSNKVFTVLFLDIFLEKFPIKEIPITFLDREKGESKIPKFENNLSKKVNSKYSVTFNSATSALHSACIALGLKKNDWLWTSANSFVASANCGLYCGAQVDFIDIDKKTYNISIPELERKLVQAKIDNKIPKIIVPVHFAGQPTMQKEIFHLSQKYNFKIIEDASHSLGSKKDNDIIGNCRWSDISVFSFHPVKIVTTGEGGAALTNNNDYAKKMKLLGKAGCGQLAKMVNQICIAGLVQGLSEGINFGMKAGLNMEDVIEVISKGAAQSWQMENRYKTMIDDKFDFGFAVDWMRKDLKIAMEEAKNNGSLLPVTELVDKYYGEVQGMGGNRWDTSSLIKRFRK